MGRNMPPKTHQTLNTRTQHCLHHTPPWLVITQPCSAVVNTDRQCSEQCEPCRGQHGAVEIAAATEVQRSVLVEVNAQLASCRVIAAGVGVAI